MRMAWAGFCPSTRYSSAAPMLMSGSAVILRVLPARRRAAAGIVRGAFQPRLFFWRAFLLRLFERTEKTLENNVCQLQIGRRNNQINRCVRLLLVLNARKQHLVLRLMAEFPILLRCQRKRADVARLLENFLEAGLAVDLLYGCVLTPAASPQHSSPQNLPA